MVAKVNHGSSIYGTVMYNQEKVKDHHAHVISGNRMITDVHGDPEKSMQQILSSFDNYLLANKNTKKPVLHISLNPSPKDHLSDEKLSNLAKDYMEKMGYGDQPWIVFKHTDIDRHHIHIVSVNVDENGNKISDRFEWERSMKVCRELESTYNLQQIADKEKEVDDLYLKKVEAGKGDIKRQIANVLKTVATSYKYQSFGEYSAMLSCFNIEAKLVKGEYNGTPYNGIVYIATDDNAKAASLPFKSSLFGKTYGFDALNKRMKKTSEKFKNGEITPKIKDIVSNSMQSCGANRERFVNQLKSFGIDTIFRENDEGRIYGVTFVDHRNKEVYNGSRLGKEFSANVFHGLFNDRTDVSHMFDRSNHLYGSDQNQHYDKSSVLEQAFGLFNFGQHGANYEEEAFERRLKKKKRKPPRHTL